jgi:hypothetical protein
MRHIRRFFKRLSFWAIRRRDEERLRAEIEEHLALELPRIMPGFAPMRSGCGWCWGQAGRMLCRWCCAAHLH